MASVPNVAELAFYVADGCAKILVPLLRFLDSTSTRSAAVEAALFLLAILPVAYVTGVILAHFAGVVLAYLHLAAPIPATAPLSASQLPATMAAAPNVAVLAFHVAKGCAKIMVPLLCFLGRRSPRSTAADDAAVFLLLVLPTAYVAGVILAHIAGVVLAYLHPATAPLGASQLTATVASAPNVALLAFYIAKGCAKIMVPLLSFLGRPSPRSTIADVAAVFLLLVLPVAYVSGVILAHVAALVLAYLHLAAPIPATAPAAAVSFADLARFVVMVFTLVSAWLLLIAVPFAAFCYLAGSK